MPEGSGMKISIITTVYNAERSLPRLLDSMTAQKSDALEFFLIDNGSSDKSASICEEYLKRDNRFKIHTLKDNIGYVGARNLGMQIIDGDYIGFCDSDDFLEPGGYDRAVEIIAKTRCDFYLAAYNAISDGRVAKHNPPYKVGLYQSDEIREVILPQTFGFLPGRGVLHGFAWKQIIRSRIVRENRIAFLETLKPYEDQLFNTDVISKCDSVRVDESVIYNYVVNEDSITARMLSKFDSEFEQERVFSLYAEKKKRALREIEREAGCNLCLERIYSCILNMVKQTRSIVKTAMTIRRYFDNNLADEIMSGSSRQLSLKYRFTRFCLKRRLFLVLSFFIKAAIKLRRG